MDSPQPIPNSSTPLPAPQEAATWLLSIFSASEALDVLRLSAQFDGAWSEWLDAVGLWIANPAEALRRAAGRARR